MKKYILVILIGLSISIPSYAGTTLELKIGQGEFKNKFRTDRVEFKGVYDTGNYFIAIKGDKLKSTIVDDVNYSLIDGSNVYIGAGFTKFNTDFAGYVSKDYFQLEVINKANTGYRGLYTITGMNYLNRYKQGRKTTSAIVGLGKNYNNKYCEVTYTVRNNTAISVDDYLLVGCGVKF